MASISNHLHPNAYGYHDKEVANKYQIARPSYPKEAIDYITNELNISKDEAIVEIGSGTGKFTSLIAKVGFKNITCVEPSGEFRDICKASLETIKNEEQPDLEFKVLDGLATQIPCPDNSASIVFCIQSFHWYSNFESIKEISRVLKPGGILLLLWNTYDREANSEFEPILKIFRGDKDKISSVGSGGGSETLMTSPFSQSYEWMNVFKDNQDNEEFKKLVNPLLEKRLFNYKHLTNTEKTIMAIHSISFVAILPQEKKDALTEKLRSTLDSFDSTKGGKDFYLHYNTEMYITRKPISN